MSHSTPATLLVWAVLSTLLWVFLVHHIYRYDRFKCLKWNNALQNGAFKRIMTYTYLVNIPLIAVYSVGFAVIKYKMAWSFVPGHGIIPTPWQLWPKEYQHAILPLYLVFSVGWSLELVTHLEELCFWLFLVNAGRQQDWFRSVYFKLWIGGSVVSIIYMPLVTILTRQDPLKNEAYTFLAGSLGSLCITLWFTPILWTFPKFLENLRAEGVDKGTLLRLVKFHELNTIRIVFRFIFTVSLIILGADGARPHQHINDSCFWTELLSILASIAVTVSSGITLVIFFPRSIETEYNLKQASKSSMQLRQRAPPGVGRYPNSPQSPTKSYPSETHITSGTQDAMSALSSDVHGDIDAPVKNPFDLESYPYTPPVTFAPNRRLDSGATVHGNVTVLDARGLASRAERASVHPFVTNYTSPIDVIQGEGESYGPAMRRR